VPARQRRHPTPRLHCTADADAMFHRLWAHRAAPWCALILVGLSLVAVRTWVDLSPRVETEFFFSADDPQLKTSNELAERYPAPPQVVIRTQDLDGNRDAYQKKVGELTERLLGLDGVEGGFSISTDDPRSPLFGRILLNPDSTSTNIVLQVSETDPRALVTRLDTVLADFRSDQLGIVMSGVPVIVELIRKSLFRDLVVFSLAAFLMFGGLVALVYRDAAILLGTLVASLTSVSLTLLLTRMIGIGVGLLTANIVTIVFVLTLSHIVFLTANWRLVTTAEASPTDRATAVQGAVRMTFEGSFWSMTTTFLGFLSLLIATAKPLRELGLAGGIGALTAMAVAYTVYPIFLVKWARLRDSGPSAPTIPSTTTKRFSGTRSLAAIGGVTLLIGTGLFRLNTDPGLLTYFSRDSELRRGLELIDGDGGSSTLSVAVRDRDGRRIDDADVYNELWALQDSLEADPAVGVVLSPATLLSHARTLPLARFLPLSVLMDLAQSEQLGEVGLAFATRARDEGLFFLRMRESADTGSRQEVMGRVTAYARQAGLDPVQMGGLYDLQAQLGTLISSSLRIGLGGLLLLFILVSFTVSRKATTSAAMLACLAGIPLVVLGSFGHAGVAIDIITSPAANVALAMGVDSMIHLVVRVRRLEGAGMSWAEAWPEARRQIGRPVLAATLIICAGFGIFGLSAFPPTQRFGVAVILGTITAATMALVTLPTWASTVAVTKEAPTPVANP
jgi:uncharacterized protein